MDPGGLTCHVPPGGGRSPADGRSSEGVAKDEAPVPELPVTEPPAADVSVADKWADEASPEERPSAASALAPSDGSLDSVAFAGISLTRTVPSSSPRPAPVTGGGCPQYPALRRRTTRCSRSQHGPDGFRSRLRQHFQSSNQPTPR